MTEPHELLGRWWLPHHQHHKVTGIFRWDPDSGGTLNLHAELHPVEWKDNVLPDGGVQKYRERPRIGQRYPVIWGQVESRAVTLLDSFCVTVREFGEDDALERIHVNRLLDGALYEDPEAIDVDRVVIDIRHLTGWVGQSGLKTDHPRRDVRSDDRFSVITARTLPALTADHRGTSVRFVQSLGEEGDFIHDLGISQRWSLRLVHPEPRSLSPFMDTASDIQDLVTIAVGKAADFESVRLQHPALCQLLMDGTPKGDRRQSITYHAQWANRSEPSEPVSRHQMYFTLEDLGGMDGVGRWLDVAEEYRTELSRTMATRYSASMFLEDRIMNISAALDSFDKVRRQTGNAKVDYVERIRQCIEFAGEPFLDLLATEPTAWANRVKAARHDLAHHKERFRREGTVGDHLHAERLFWLFSLCMLRLAEAPETVFGSISNHAQVRWLKEQEQEERT
jgi:hypothetical protein